MMDRVNGWYKRKIGLFIFLIGFGMCMIMNVDSIQIVKTLADNPDKAQEMVKLAMATVDAENKYQTGATKKDSITNDSAHLNFLKKRYESTKGTIEKSQYIMANGWVFPDSIYAEKNITFKKYFKIKHIIFQSLPFWKLKFWGLTITALALSLGAQFWFDLLKKLIAIRGAGVKPEEKPKYTITPILPIAGPVNDGLALNTKDPVKIAIAENRGYWESLPGFIAMNEDYDDQHKRYIKLVFEKGQNPYDEREIEIDKVKIKCVEGVKGSLSSNGMIANGALIQPHMNSWGSPAGIVLNPRTNKYAILTCGHVIRTEDSSFIDPDHAAVQINHNNNRMDIGKAKYMVMSGYCDAGIVDLDMDPEDLDKIYKIYRLSQYRDVSFTENGKTNVMIKTLRGDVKGKLIRAGEYYTFNDKGVKDVRYLDLIKIGVPDGTTSNEPLTLEGDSGSLITDENQIPIGILVGGSREDGKPYSFGIKMKDIFEILQIHKFRIL